MSIRVKILNKRLREYDSDLFCIEDGYKIHVYRRKYRMNGSFSYAGDTYLYPVLDNQYIFSLTEDWTFDGRGVPWGVDPILNKLRAMDSWTDDTAYENFVKRRETQENWKKQSIKQDFRARAADLRSDFAKATNDYIQPAGLKNKSIVGG